MIRVLLVDDEQPARDHLRQNFPRNQERRGDVHAQEALPVGQLNFRHGLSQMDVRGPGCLKMNFIQMNPTELRKPWKLFLKAAHSFSPQWL